MSNHDAILNAMISNIDKTKTHRMQLSEQLDEVVAAKQQVTSSHGRSLRELQEHFNKLRSNLNELLTNRENILRSEVEQIEKDALAPLETCEKLVRENLNSCAQLMERGKRLLLGDHEASTEAIQEYNQTVDSASFDHVSAVPALQDVQCIHVDLPRGLDSELAAMLDDYGTVFARAPVQITEIHELPGALKVHWNEIEEENDLDLTEFKLQCCHGKAVDSRSADFRDAYQGSNKSAVVRCLALGQEYSLMVCGKSGEAQGWSPWSVPVTSATFLPHYEWASDSKGYALNSDCRLATKQSAESCVLFSRGASFTCGHSVLFKILQEGDASKEDGFFLSSTQDVTNPCMQKGTLFINSEGKIFQDGEQRTTHLEKFSRRCSITFDTETLEENKIRITIEMNNKYSVTFDWTVDITNQCTGQSDSGMAMMGGATVPDTKKQAINLYFGAKFTLPGWRFSVE